MYAFRVYYSNGKKSFHHIVKAQYAGATLEGEDMLTHAFPIDEDFHLFSSDTHYVVAHKNIIRIEVTKEQPK